MIVVLPNRELDDGLSGDDRTVMRLGGSGPQRPLRLIDPGDSFHQSCIR
jgi:hypothetical protein